MNASAWFRSTATTENPGVFTLNLSTHTWLALTIAVPPDPNIIVIEGDPVVITVPTDDLEDGDEIDIDEIVFCQEVFDFFNLSNRLRDLDTEGGDR